MTDARDAAGIVVETDVMVRMRDGVHLACDIYRPASCSPVPALVQRQPYDKRVAQTYVYDHPAVYARHGYAVVIEDTRGRYASEGEFYPLRFDAEDGYDTIEWCAAQPWCNGRVGSFGFSIPGVNQLLAAALKPPHLAVCRARLLSRRHVRGLHPCRRRLRACGGDGLGAHPRGRGGAAARRRGGPWCHRRGAGGRRALAGGALAPGHPFPGDA